MELLGGHESRTSVTRRRGSFCGGMLAIARDCRWPPGDRALTEDLAEGIAVSSKKLAILRLPLVLQVVEKHPRPVEPAEQISHGAGRNYRRNRNERVHEPGGEDEPSEHQKVEIGIEPERIHGNERRDRVPQDD